MDRSKGQLSASWVIASSFWQLAPREDCEDDCKWGVARDWLLKLNDPSKWSQHEKEIEELRPTANTFRVGPFN